MGLLALDASGLMPWLAVGNILVSSLIALLVWVFTGGRYSQKQESGQQSVLDRVATLETDMKADHDRRGYVNAKIGALVTDVAVLQTKVNEHERRLGRYDEGRKP